MTLDVISDCRVTTSSKIVDIEVQCNAARASNRFLSCLTQRRHQPFSAVFRDCQPPSKRETRPMETTNLLEATADVEEIAHLRST
jgi:hypothetical protein